MERKNNNCVVHVRQDSDNDLEALFHVISKNSVAKTHPEPASSSQSLPMRLRKLPPSFFKQPPIDGSLSPDQDVPKRLPISHSHSRSSPASLTVPTTLKGPPNHSLSPGVHHQRSTSFDNTALLEEPTPMPPGWEMRTTASGQRYFMNHFEQLTTWQDPRKTQSTSNLNSVQPVGNLPDGWEQAITPEGDIYYINHIERTTSWIDPRLAMHCRNQENMRSTLPPDFNRQGHRTLQLHRLQREREQLLKRQQELLKQEIKLKRDILEEGGKPSLLGNLTREFSAQDPPVTNGGHIRDESFDSGLGMGGGNYQFHDVDMNDSQPMFDANYNSKDTSFRADPRIPEILDSLPGTNVDLGVMEGTDNSTNMETEDLGVGLEFNSEILNDMESVLISPTLTWL